MKKVEDNSFETYQLKVDEKYVFRFSYMKYFWRFLFVILAITKLASLYFDQHPKFYRVFNLFFMDDIPKQGPMFLKIFLNQKIPSEYLTSYPLIALISILGLLLVWWILLIITSTISINYKFVELKTGIISENLSSIDLIQVRDQDVITPWYNRLLGLGNVFVESKDPSTPHLWLRGLSAKDARFLYNLVRENSYINITDLRRSQIVEEKSKKKKQDKTDLEDDGDGYSD